MATAATIVANDAGAPVGDLEVIALDDTYMIRTDQIDLGERLRPVDPVWAQALGAMMARDGQRTAIEVCRLPGSTRWTLVTGGHRLVGAQHAEIEHLRAQEVSPNRHERLLSEVLENLARRDLDPIDRAAFIAELVTLHKVARGIDPTKDGRSASVQARWQKELKEEASDTNVTMTVVYGWTADVAAQLGYSKSVIERDLLLYRRLSPSLIARLREAQHPLVKNGAQLRALLKLDHDGQQRAVDLLLAGSVKTIGDAIGKVQGTNRATDPQAKLLSTFLGSFDRMGVTEKKGALLQLAGLLPAGFRLVEGDEEAATPIEDVRPALDAAFKVLVQVVDGEPADPDEALEVCGQLQGALLALDGEAVAQEPAAPELQPAVAIRASVKPDYLVCLECGEKHPQLTRHLSSKHGLTKETYLQRWKLPLDYPFIAPNVAEVRRQQAAKIGLRSGAKPGEAK